MSGLQITRRNIIDNGVAKNIFPDTLCWHIAGIFSQNDPKLYLIIKTVYQPLIQRDFTAICIGF